jgi:Cu2+-exporting ATPase
MKTSVIEVHDMLAVLTVDDVEKRFGEVPGVESATVNYAAGNATVRYDETLLEVADIKILVHQRGQHGAGDAKPDEDSKDKPVHQHDEGAMPDASASATSTVPSAAKTHPLAAASSPASAAPAAEGQEAEPVQSAPASPAVTAPSV